MGNNYQDSISIMYAGAFISTMATVDDINPALPIIRNIP